MRRRIIAGWLAVSSGFMPCAMAGMDRDIDRAWLEGGIGAASVSMQASGLSEGEGAAVISMALGYRATRSFGVGLEYASSAPMYGCQHWDCGGAARDFKPQFNRASLFGELRMFHGQLRLRYGVGDASYCYAGGRGWDLWGMVLTGVLDDDEYLDQPDCKAVHGLARSASLSYHWRTRYMDSPLSIGLRLGLEDSSIHGRQSIGLPSMRYRATTFTVQLAFN
jgi:hypothetical protein